MEILKKSKKVSISDDPRFKKNSEKTNKRKSKLTAKTQKNKDKDTISLHYNDRNHTFLKLSKVGWPVSFVNVGLTMLVPVLMMETL